MDDKLSLEEREFIEKLIEDVEAEMSKNKTPLSKMNFSNPVMHSVFVAMVPISLPLVIKKSAGKAR